MHLGIKAKQIGGVTLIVGLAVVALSALHVTSVARVLLVETRKRGEVLADTIFLRAEGVVAGQADPWAAITADGGLRTILRSGGLAPNVTYAAICNVADVAVAAWVPDLEGNRLAAARELDDLIRAGSPQHLFGIYSPGGAMLEVRRPLARGARSSARSASAGPRCWFVRR